MTVEPGPRWFGKCVLRRTDEAKAFEAKIGLVLVVTLGSPHKGVFVVMIDDP